MHTEDISTPVGAYTAEFDADGVLVSLERRQSTDRRTALGDLLRRELDDYFALRLRQFTVRVAPGGTEFQQRVWRELQAIPWGELRNYGEIARSIGSPGASRAVGAANGSNPIAIVIPCHRVVAANGSLGGYTGGVGVKHALLTLEGHRPATTAEPDARWASTGFGDNQLALGLR
jgi:methylated-DNA-[protein]-cysteine S-methyltransferase